MYIVKCCSVCAIIVCNLGSIHNQFSELIPILSLKLHALYELTICICMPRQGSYQLKEDFYTITPLCSLIIKLFYFP